MWQIIGASVKGSSHYRTGLPCQDFHDHEILDNFAVASVADGLGSAQKSDEGSKIAVRTSIEYIKSYIQNHEKDNCNETDWNIAVLNAFIEARKKLSEIAQAYNLPVKYFATTLLIALMTPNLVITGHIGDGAIIARFNDTSIRTISAPERGEYANEVMPVTSSNALDSIRINTFTSIDALALLTDGIQHLTMNLSENRPFVPFFEPFFNAITSKMNIKENKTKLAEFLNSDMINSKTDDDKTLVIIGLLENSL